MHWYGINSRNLPWRETKDPYRIWLSEVILQQTRVEQGLPYYKKFIKVFPTVYDLAKSKEENVFEEKHILHMIKNIRQNYPPSLWNTIYQLTKQGHINNYLNDEIDNVIENVVNESSQDTSV